MQGVLNLDSLSRPWYGALGVMPELLLIDSGKSLKTRFGEDSFVNLKETLDIDFKNEVVLTLKDFWDWKIVLFTLLYEDVNGLDD